MGWFYPRCNAFDTSGIIQDWNGSNLSKQRTASSSLTCWFLYPYLWHNQSQFSIPQLWAAEPGGGFRLLCTSRSCSPSAQHLLWCQVSFPRRAIRDMPVGLHQSRWSTRPHCHGVADGRAGFTSPATCLLLADAEPFCGLSWSCWSWGESSSFLSWCLGWSTLCSPAPVLPCSLWVLSAPGECSHLKSNTKVIIIKKRGGKKKGC